jgi:hypothetical protein
MQKLQPGDLVFNPRCQEWGAGEIFSVDEKNATVDFAHAGRKRIVIAVLTPAQLGPEASTAARDEIRVRCRTFDRGAELSTATSPEGQPEGEQRPLTTLARSPEVNTVSGFADRARRFDHVELCQRYEPERRNAPRRFERGKAYFVGHDGIPGTGAFTDRLEEHLAIVLAERFGPPESGLPLPDGRELRLLDYQVPLKARLNDLGVGKIDLLGLTSDGRLAVVELKIDGAGAKDTPLRALVEALAYAAIVDANLDAIVEEVATKWRLHVVAELPEIILVAPDRYWNWYQSNPAAGNWQAEIGALSRRIKEALGLSVSALALRCAAPEPGLNGSRPRLLGPVTARAAF